MNTKGSVVVLFLCFLSLFTLTVCNTCDINKLEGDILSLKLTKGSLKDDDQFIIKKDDRVLVRRRNKKQDGPGILKNDFMEFKDVKQNDSGSYTVDVFNVQGQNLNSYTNTVCVYAKVPKPRVNVTTCQDKKVNITCDVDGKDLSFSWKKNGKDWKKTEKVISNILADNSNYLCTAQNPVHKNTSDSVKVKCKDTLFGFDLWIMVTILAAGGTLVLLLIIVLVTLSCRSCKRKEKHQQDEEEFRLNYLNTNQAPQKGKQTARGQPAPPEPINNGSAEDLAEAPHQAAPRPRKQQRGRPPPPPIDDDEEQPPPLPQPRKKAHDKRQLPM